MRRSAAVPLGGSFTRRSLAVAAGLLLVGTGAAACSDDEEQQDARPVCGYEEDDDFVVVDQDECDDDDRDHDHYGHPVFFYHYPMTQYYYPGYRMPRSGSAFVSRPSTVSRGYGGGTVRTGGFGSGAKGGSGGG